MEMAMARNATAYPAVFEPEPKGGFTVTFCDLPGVTYGATREEAQAQAHDLLEEVVLGLMAHGEDIPLPRRSRPTDACPLITLPALTAAKLEVYRVMRDAGLNKSQLAERLGWQPSQVTRLFDGRHASRLDQIEAALAVFGRRLVIGSEAA
jgi:antitoxin HicB